MESCRLGERSKSISSPLFWGSTLVFLSIILIGMHVEHYLHHDMNLTAAVTGVYIPLLVTVFFILPIGVLQLANEFGFYRIQSRRRRHALEWMSIWAVIGIPWALVSATGAVIFEVNRAATFSHGFHVFGIFATYGIIPWAAIGYFYGRVSEKSRRLTEHKMILFTLNRFLRHNIRNEGNVVVGNLNLLHEELDNENAELTQKAESGLSAMERILEASEKQRSIIDVLSEDKIGYKEINKILEDVVVWATETYPNASITFNNSEGHAVEVKAHTHINRAFRELVENSIVHAETDTPSVEINLKTSTSHAIIDLFDDSSGVPETEIEGVLEETKENKLLHGSGVGLCIVDVIIRSVDNGSVTFNPHGSDATVRVSLPLA